jgi:hypothetical protein
MVTADTLLMRFRSEAYFHLPLILANHYSIAAHYGIAAACTIRHFANFVLNG